MSIKSLKPRIKRYIIKIRVVFEKATSTLSQELFFDILANHEEVSNILRVETKRGTISIQAVLEHMNFDAFQRPETQDQTIIWQKNILFLKQSRTHYPPRNCLLRWLQNIKKVKDFTCGGQTRNQFQTMLENMNFDDYQKH